MRFTPLRVIAAMLAVACAAAGAGTVIAQGQAPTPPTPPAGTLAFELAVTLSASNPAVNTASGRPFRGGAPRAADYAASHGTVRQNGQRTGRYFILNTTVTPPRDQRGRGYAAIGSVIVDFGDGNQLMLGDAIISPEGDVVGPVVGGTGRYAGARGVATSRVTRQTRTQLVQAVMVQFMP